MTLQPPEEQNSETEPEVAEIEGIETLKEALAEEKAKAENNLAGWQRAQADFINYKRRSEQEKEEIGKFANSTLMFSILPVLDDLERAFASIPAHLAKLKALGEPFDPNLHEAAMHGKGKEGMVVEELQKGYKLHDRVIRPSMVVVGNGEEEKKEE